MKLETVVFSVWLYEYSKDEALKSLPQTSHRVTQAVISHLVLISFVLNAIIFIHYQSPGGQNIYFHTPDILSLLKVDQLSS
jgi:hypothetical protein